MTFVLEITELSQRHGPPERDVARGRVDPELDSKRAPVVEPVGKLLFPHDVLGPPGEPVELIARGTGRGHPSDVSGRIPPRKAA
jgi:hypothetical protein